MERQNDIEIYIRSNEHPRLLAWLKAVFRDVHIVDIADDYTFLDGSLGDHIIRIVMQSNIAEGAYTRIWFNSPHAPWATDADCARQAARALGVEVRCDPGFLSDFPGHFLSVVNDHEVLVDWDSEMRESDG